MVINLQDREKFRRIVEDTKAHPGLWRQEEGKEYVYKYPCKLLHKSKNISEDTQIIKIYMNKSKL